MYKTKHGQFEGDSWENLMQLCFRLKYESEHYQPVPASSGDFGIEGFTTTGKVFQCYCPDNNMGSKELYEKQRDKITADIPKLKLYEKKLKRILGDVKIKEWIFVTPEFLMNDLLGHCKTKEAEILAENCDILDPSFKVIVHDIDFFQKEIPIATYTDGSTLFIAAESMDGATMTKWKDQEIDLVANALRKHGKRFSSDAQVVEEKVNTLTDRTIESFLEQQSILSRWQKMHTDDYDKFLILLGQIEKEVQEKCMFPSENNNELYASLFDLVKQRIKENFGYLNDITIQTLTHGAIADWLLRCPLNFE